jgi:hypothetical protein
MPEAYGLAGDAELVGDLGLAEATGEQLGGAQPAGLKPLAFLLCRRVAGNGWHGRILPATGSQFHPSAQYPRP